jgi:hemerythrin-like domain-containing protein
MTIKKQCTCGHGSPTEILKSEHRVIERVLDAVERFAARDRIDAESFRQAIDFLRNFADGCHHAKEENVLFPRMEAAGIPHEGGPIGCMLDEHTHGRSLIARMAENVDPAARGDARARDALRAAASEYVDLLRKHIWKEDNVVSELADRALACGDRNAMLAGFDRTEQSAANAGKHERYLRLADELERRSRESAIVTGGVS